MKIHCFKFSRYSDILNTASHLHLKQCKSVYIIHYSQMPLAIQKNVLRPHLKHRTQYLRCIKYFITSLPIIFTQCLIHLFQVKRLQSTNARSWALKYIPPLLRESLIHQASVILSHNAVAKFWSILYSPQLYHVAIPNDLGTESIFP